MRFILSAILVSFLAVTGAQALEVSAGSAILLDARTGEILYEKDADTRRMMASTTKIMTALVAIETSDINSQITVPDSCTTVEGSKMYLKAGEEVTLKDALYGLMLLSGNDAAVAIAVHCAGSVEKFVKLMNKRAENLGLSQTHFANPHGLEDKNHYSSARDMAKLMAVCMENNTFAEIAGTKSTTAAGRQMTNHNKLLWNYEGINGGKTGYIEKAGRCLVTSAGRDGVALVAVTLNAPSDWSDHSRMYDYGFSQYEDITLLDAEAYSLDLPVISGTARLCTIVAKENVRIKLRKGSSDRLVRKIELSRFFWAPVAGNAVAGSAVWYLDGKELVRTSLYFENGVELNESGKKSSLWTRFLKFLPLAE